MAPKSPHSVDLYTIGKGILYIALWNGTTPPTYPDDYVDVGNCTSFTLEPTTEQLPHYSSRSGLRTKDKNPTISLEYAVNFTLDEIAAANINRFLMGTLDASGDVIHGLQNADQEYGLYFVSDNPIGENQVWKMWRMTLKPAGAMQLIGEEYLEMQYTGEGLSDSANHASSPYFDVQIVTTTSTTTTTTTTA